MSNALRKKKSALPAAVNALDLFDKLLSGRTKKDLTPVIIRAEGRAEFEMLHSQALVTLATALKDGTRDSKPIPRVPMGLSMSRVVEVMQDETT